MGEVWERRLRERGYKIMSTLGEGAYSKVKLAYSTRLGNDVAIKCINKQVAPKDFVEKFLPRELQALPHLRHENIVKIYEILEASDGFVYIVMEAARNGDMLRYVQRRGALPEEEIKKYFWQLVQAIKYCHSMNICHRDLKCENLLLDKENKLLLTDFGFSKSMIFNAGNVVLSSTFCGSAAYAAPEIIRGHPYDPRMHDIWSMGVILYIMACGHMPFDDSNVRKMLKVQLKNQIRFPPRVADILSDELKHLIKRMIQPDITKRANMDDVLAHPFFGPLNGSRPTTSSNVAQHIYDFFAGRPTTSYATTRPHGIRAECGCDKGRRPSTGSKISEKRCCKTTHGHGTGPSSPKQHNRTYSPTKERHKRHKKNDE
uniref:testis-specific serine/threonine-protein kinase 1-like n=1 Tax=Styela clava TaxID=7725 RepID=UPI00193A3038|nr:testis-specific serine/threonine-protein kinase 1-like [Styela clava]